jgi:hypothetical protein
MQNRILFGIREISTSSPGFGNVRGHISEQNSSRSLHIIHGHDLKEKEEEEKGVCVCGEGEVC